MHPDDGLKGDEVFERMSFVLSSLNTLSRLTSSQLPKLARIAPEDREALALITWRMRKTMVKMLEHIEKIEESSTLQIEDQGLAEPKTLLQRMKGVLWKNDS
jgi:hypothetical protein